MSQTQINPQMMANANMQANINQPNVPNVLPNVQNAPNAPNAPGPGPNMGGNAPNLTVPNVNVANVGGPTQMSGTGQMNNMNQINPMINMHNMARGQPGNVLFQGSKLSFASIFLSESPRLQL